MLRLSCVVLVTAFVLHGLREGIAAPSVTPTPQADKAYQPPLNGSSEGIEDYLGQFVEKSIDFCSELARSGDPDAHYCVAVKLRRASSSGKDSAYVEHLRTAAQAGNMFAQNDLGDALLGKAGVPQDYKEAFQWFTRAAGAGMPHAMVSVGWMYMCGYGMPIDYEKARSWNRKGASWEHPEGANNLGWLLEQGLGGPKSLERARYWYTMAANWGSEEAADRLANLESKSETKEPNKNYCKQ